MALPADGWGDLGTTPIFCIDFGEQDATDAASTIHRFLNRDALIGGTALEEAQREFESQERDRRLRVALQEAWLRMLADPQGLLRDLLGAVGQARTGAPRGQDRGAYHFVAVCAQGCGASVVEFRQTSYTSRWPCAHPCQGAGGPDRENRSGNGEAAR